MISEPSVRSPWWSHVIQWFLVLWASGLLFYFYVKEGLIRWDWLFAEPGRVGFQRPPAADMATAPYVQIIGNALGSYDIQWGNAPWLAFAISAGMLVGYTLVGWLLLSAFRVFAPLAARLCLALTLGCGAIGVGCELLAMAHQLNPMPVILVWVGMLMLGLLCWSITFSRRNKMQSLSAHSQLSPAEQKARARDWFWNRPWPGAGGKILWAVFALLFSLITLVVTLHAIGEPVSYWDSLILYVGYARATYLEGGFPLKVVGQVGIGLGANYPHMFEVLAAQTATLSGFWSDSFAQLLPPVVVTAALVLVYYTVLELSGDRLIAMASALLVRAVPYGLSYTQFASNYSLAILFTAAFIYVAVRLVRDGLGRYRHLMLIIAAGAVHINYLMWGLWPVTVLAVLLAHWRFRIVGTQDVRWQQSDPGTPLPVYPPEFMMRPMRPAVLQLLAKRDTWLILIMALAIASPWYIRNVVVTGNPVYAFYSNVFPSKNVSPAVMKSAEHEWMLNGDGLANVGRTLGEKLVNSWLYFVTGAQHWKLAPTFMGLVVPGFAVWLLWWMGRGLSSSRRQLDGEAAGPETRTFRAIAVVASLFLLLWFYAYVVADFYLYQIIVVLPLFGVFAGVVFMYCRSRAARMVLYTLTLLIALAPGLVMGIMGFKLKKTGIYENMPAPQFTVTALRQLFMSPARYYRMEYGGDMDMIAYLNNTLPDGTVILTHENRHLLLKPGLKIVHLDDWETQQVYHKPMAQRLAALDKLGVKYYLYVPNESRHIANSWLGMEELIKTGYFVKDLDTSSPDSGAPDYPLDVTPRDMNVLYKRSAK